MKRVARWIGAVFGLVVFALLIIIAWGTGLPMYHVASCVADYRQTPQELFAVVEDDVDSTAWRSDVVKVSRSTDAHGKPLFTETDHNAQAIVYAEVSTGRDRAIAREIADRNLPFGGKWTYVFRPGANDGTQLTITEYGVIYNPVFRFVERYFLGYSARQRTYLQDLGRKYGESPSVSCKVQIFRNSLTEYGAGGTVPPPNAKQPSLGGGGY